MARSWKAIQQAETNHAASAGFCSAHLKTETPRSLAPEEHTALAFRRLGHCCYSSELPGPPGSVLDLGRYQTGP